MQRSWRFVGIGGLIVALLGILVVFFRAPREKPAKSATADGVPPAVPTKVAPTETKNAAPRSAAIAPERITRLGALPLPEELQRPGASTLDEALRLLGELAEGEDRSAYFQKLIAFCIGRDPAATLEVVAALADERLREFGVLIALGAWSSSDSAAALHWAADHPRGPNDNGRFHAAYEGYAAQQPLEALQMLTRPELAGEIDALVVVAIFHLDSQNRLAEARAWLEQLPEGNLRELLVQRVMNVWAPQSPEAAVAWLASTASDATFRDGMGALVHAVAYNDPRFAAGLTQKFSDPKIRQDFLADVVYLWTKRDLGGAAAWLREQKPAPQLDAAFARMVEATVKLDPAEAMAWANAISDPAKRAAALRVVSPGG